MIHHFPLFVAWLCAIQASLVLFGWITHIRRLVQFHASFAPMQFNTALTFLGIAFLIPAVRANRIYLARALSLTLITLPLLTLFQDAGGYNFGIDQLFFTSYITAGTPYPGRMAPNTSISFVLISLISIALTLRRKSNVIQMIAIFSSAMVFALGAIAIFGYMVNAVSAFGWSSFTQMSLPTAVLLVFIASSLIVLTLRDAAAGLRRRVFYPALVSVSALFLTILGWRAALETKETQLKETTRIQGEYLRDVILTGLEDRSMSLVRMVKRWESNNGTPEILWREDALVYADHLKGIAAVAYADNDTVVRWIEPQQENSRAVGFKLNSEINRRNAVSLARNSGKTALSGAIELKQGGLGFALISPIDVRSSLSGFLLLGINYDAFFRHLVRLNGYSIWIVEDNRNIFELNREADSDLDPSMTTLNIPLHGTEWAINISPSPSTRNNLASLVASYIFGVGILLSLLFGFLIYLYQVAQDANQKSARLIRWNAAIVDGSQLAIVSTDSAGLVKSFNPAAEHLLGYSATDVIDRDTFALFLELGRPGFDVLIAQKKLGEVYQDQRVLQTRSKEQKSVALAMHALSDQSGIINGYVMLIEDITEKMKQEAQLNEALNRAESATIAKSQFLANMSHEIRTPLNGVLGMAGLLLDSSLTEAQRSQAQAVETSAENLMVIINDILDISKIEAGKLELEEIEYTPEEIVDNVEATLAYFAKRKGIQLIKRQRAPQTHSFSGDPTRLRQVLLNLVSNAIKFTPEGSVTISVTEFYSGNQIATLRFEVTDTGIGIPIEAQKRIFEVFSQAESSTTRRFGGTGLGLSISKHLVDLMKGRIGVVSTSGHGSVFWFEIDAPVKILKENVIINTEVRSSEIFRILLAEDNTVNQIITKTMLQKYGHRVDVAANGFEALDALRDAPYNLILMDCQMPEMDGFEATRIIRRSLEASFRSIPIIAMTANAMSGDRELCLTAGMTDYVTKPIKAEALLTVIHDVMSRAKTSS